ncbi:hypothetical protein [Sphingorhabdus sp. M41]|uniref:hypothetical protein n=1 Tax=Sphingorhabdus sp. M41 TaxID=1806885 RepID=UPI00078DC445|nr:hypothetical protein [Sphingorhabdus sp. M41]AMO71235.1 hypothetical protein AZE99_04600 [Sphingorhabdus sp. M41]
MSISRRNVLKSGIAVAAVSAGSTTALASRSADLIIFDSRHPVSAGFANARFAHKIDIAHEDANFWRNLRSGTESRKIAGMTGWSDFVLARGFLEEHGKRLTVETLQDGLFFWEMR